METLKKEKNGFLGGKSMKNDPRKKLPHGVRTLLLVLAVVAGMALAVFIGGKVILGRMGKSLTPGETVPPHMQQIETEDPNDTLPGSVTSPTVNREDITWDDVEQLQNKDVINILLIGQDARPGEDRARSDSMILVSINKQRSTIHMTSFMRDLYVQIPGYMDDRINVAYRYGGAELLDKTIQENFGVTVDGNVAVNFDQFCTVVDILGGVDVEMDSEEAWYMNEKMDLGPVEEGMNHLNGEQALGFARIRYITGSDFARTDRQRRILASIAQELKSVNAGQVLDLLSQVLPNVSTDLSQGELVSYLAAAATVYLGGGELISGRVPEDDAYYPANIDGADVLVPYLNKCQEYLRDSIYSGD